MYVPPLGEPSVNTFTVLSSLQKVVVPLKTKDTDGFAFEPMLIISDD
jgi:hypothetical protein